MDRVLLANLILIINFVGTSMVVIDVLIPKNWIAWINKLTVCVRTLLGEEETDPISTLKRLLVAALVLSAFAWVILLIWAILQEPQPPAIRDILVSASIMTIGALIGAFLTVVIIWFSLTFQKVLHSPSDTFQLTWIGPLLGLIVATSILLLFLPGSEGFRLPIVLAASVGALFLGCSFALIPTVMSLLSSKLFVIAKIGAVILLIGTLGELILQWQTN